MSVVFRIELEREADGRWIAEVVELPGVLAYGATQNDAISRVQALALRVVADRLENEEAGSEFLNITFAAATIVILASRRGCIQSQERHERAS